jgi:hypothetical protein
MPKLFETAHEPWDAYYSPDADLSLPEGITKGSGEPVKIYCDYGDGSVWNGMATREYVTSECNFLEIYDYTDCNFKPPSWTGWSE